MINPAFWRGKAVFLTGHTGFKGAWLASWLSLLGAKVTGYALAPPTRPSLFEAASVGTLLDDRRGDIRDFATLVGAMATAQAEIVIHLAAQPLVRHSYAEPVETYAVNVLGTVHLLEAVRTCEAVRTVLIITTDKCYDNREWPWGYREIDPLGGHDPYSSSKACAELVTAAYRTSFFHATTGRTVSLASARAGNVLGGGDWAADRLVPDLIRAFATGRRPLIRAPKAIRPWQHVLEPLAGYLLLCQHLWHGGMVAAEAWNFGPKAEDARPVSWIADRTAALWGTPAGWDLDPAGTTLHETGHLFLDTSKATRRLGYTPRWDLARGLAETVAWYKEWLGGGDVAAATRRQIDTFMTSQPGAT